MTTRLDPWGMARGYADDDDWKVAKSSVEYSMGVGDGDMCARCQFYISAGLEESQCRRVKGMVESRYWCALYKAKRQNMQWR
jgi:hypothetical protein